MSTQTPAITHFRSVAEAATELRVSVDTVYRAIDRGELEAVRLGANGLLRIRDDALQAFLRPAREDG